ncbi:MAG TPA: carbamoyltransferase C-terminal domain-containing protein [Puia sp.]|nr:carbamoyltransferase C-terminal domain-containing protein [Puia sp.]
MKNSIYVLGTSLSHNGSTCLLKDGKICAAIEKERVTRIKHDGYNDTDAIKYCLEKENITLDKVDLIVQNSPNSLFEGGNHYFNGPRLFEKDCPIPIVTISHHLAHAYSAYGCSEFDNCAALVIDGSGNSLEHCIDISGDDVIDKSKIYAELLGIYKENNSYYAFEGNKCTTIFKEFSHYRYSDETKISTYTENSIGDLYGAASAYCFRGMEDAGKLMGLAPYGNPSVYKEEIFQFKDGTVYVDYSVLGMLKRPSRSYEEFKNDFQYYANIANWVQREVERAVLYVVNSRYEMRPSNNLVYSGGVALNAVINGKILTKTPFKNLYIQPAAGDNGISLGCAYYGWLEVLQKEKMFAGGTTCYGKIYDNRTVKESLKKFEKKDPLRIKKTIDLFFDSIPKLFKNGENGKEEKIIQFNVKNAGIYQVKINNGEVVSRGDILGTPTCEVSLINDDFYEGLLNPTYFNNLYELNKLEVTNFNDLDYLLDAINFGNSKGLSEFGGSDAYSDLIHYEGEGYIEEAARLIADGNIVGWFQDESEFGPRALGRRSILADPRKKGVRNFVNTEIKFREDFRPFAPSVLLEDAALYFDIQGEAPYMLTVCQVKNEWRDQIEDIVHKDGSCRIQTVTSDWNPKYYRLLKEFKRLTGLSVLLNTSFNGRAMPIVETPHEAQSFFFRGKLDYLVMQDLIIRQMA